MTGIKQQRARNHVLSVDSSGGVKVDPTENTKDLMAAALDSLATERESDRALTNARVTHIKEIGDLKAFHAEKISELRTDHLKETSELRAINQKEMRVSDLNAAEKTRQVDVLAAEAGAKSLANAVTTLQSASDRNTETLRLQVADTATKNALATTEMAKTVQASTNELFRRIDDRVSSVDVKVAALEQIAAASGGRSSVSDPQTVEMNAKLDNMATALAAVAGSGAGMAKLYGWILAGAALLFTMFNYFNGG